MPGGGLPGRHFLAPLSAGSRILGMLVPVVLQFGAREILPVGLQFFDGPEDFIEAAQDFANRGGVHVVVKFEQAGCELALALLKMAVIAHNPRLGKGDDIGVRGRCLVIPIRY